MSKRLTSIRLPEITDRQLAELASVTGLNTTELITTAIDRMYQQETTMNNEIITISSRNDAQGEWPSILPNHTVYKWNDQLWTGRFFAQGNERRIQLTPLTEEQRDYLKQRGVLKNEIK